MASRSLTLEFTLDRDMFRERDAYRSRQEGSPAEPERTTQGLPLSKQPPFRKDSNVPAPDASSQLTTDAKYELVESNAVFLAECQVLEKRIQAQCIHLGNELRALRILRTPSNFSFTDDAQHRSPRGPTGGDDSLILKEKKATTRRQFEETAHLISEFSMEIRSFRPVDRVGWGIQKALALRWRSHHTKFYKLYDAFRSVTDWMEMKSEKIRSASRAVDERTEQRLQDESRHAALLERGFQPSEINELMLRQRMAAEKSKECIDLMYELEELNHMYRDIAALITEQGSALDQVSIHIHCSIKFVAEGQREIRRAAQERARCILM